MNWEELYRLQADLDQRILDSIPQTNEQVRDDKLLAFLVEVSELANETRCFKYWSQKGANEREVILEEFVDGIHFLLSFGLDDGYRFESHQATDRDSVVTLTEAFHMVYEMIQTYKNEPSQAHYQELMLIYLSVGKLLTFSEEEIVQAYLEKNAENHNRQARGY
ncbi:dUTP diphosphatase [Halalkalibacillus halophilus]|uniref:dUTP diphosphatase n=1 Tax=Halalkalibacillus halophilus TaxID=392827 RepID=UPI0003FB5AA3|nr:dUTP diphosphatase [Halalkalibacillus halophilus]